MIALVCHNSACQGTFYEYPSNKRRYCSNACYDAVHASPARGKTCEQCGQPILHVVAGVRFCSRACYDQFRAAQPVACGTCGKVVLPSRGRQQKGYGKYCSTACYAQAKKALYLAQQEPGMRRCSRCKVSQPPENFPIKAGTSGRYHSYCYTCNTARHAQYLRENPDVGHRARAKRSARKRGALVRETVSLDVLYARDRAICSLCQKHVPRKDASTDHIIPISKGGEHSYKNCALAHKRCNSRKHVKTVLQQMRLF